MSFWANVLMGKCLLGKCLSGQMSFWANVFWANVVWANVFLGKCLSGQMLSGQMSFWANVVWAIVYGQMSLGKCRMGKCHGTKRTFRQSSQYLWVTFVEATSPISGKATIKGIWCHCLHILRG
jgi:hypothetical protein